jgi:hypothetical protein
LLSASIIDPAKLRDKQSGLFASLGELGASLVAYSGGTELGLPGLGRQ